MTLEGIPGPNAAAQAALFDPRSDPEALPRAVPAALAGGFAQGGRFAFLQAADGTRLRYAHWPAPGTKARGRVVVLGGRGEFVEKYATEIVGELRGRGFEVFSLDWRGQGLSQRALPDPDKGHVADFALYREDLHRFLTLIVGPSTEASPVLLLAHSMGGLTSLRLLTDTSGRNLVRAAVLCAPMTGLKRAWAIRAVLALAPVFARRATDYAPGAGNFAEHRLPFDRNRVTHDRRRYGFTEQWFAADPRLRLGGPTAGWLGAGLDGIAAVMRAQRLARVACPVLLLSAREDTLVDPNSHDWAARHIPHCTIQRYADAKHEIMMETDAIRARFWRDVDAFLADVAPSLRG
jgi:lysophospholipase